MGKKAVSAVYSIANTVNGKKYYGSSVNVWGRKRQHFHKLRAGTHRNAHLQAAWNLYGEVAFVFALEEEAPAEALLAVEQRYLDANHGGYNMARCVESAARGLKWSPEARANLSLALKGREFSDDHRKALSEANKGKQKSDAERRSMSERRKGQTLDGGTRAKIASTVKSLWEDGDYRERVITAQRRGRKTKKARQNRRAAMKQRWADPEHAAKLSEERKSRWQDPAYRAKMLEIRRAQGQKLREQNQQKRENEHALS